MHMDNAHSCPACFAFIRTNCFRRGGRRVGGGDVPIHRLRVGTDCSCAATSPLPGSAAKPLGALPPSFSSSQLTSLADLGVPEWERGLRIWLDLHKSWGKEGRVGLDCTPQPQDGLLLTNQNSLSPSLQKPSVASRQEKCFGLLIWRLQGGPIYVQKP